jgi:hypothetical protein
MRNLTLLLLLTMICSCGSYRVTQLEKQSEGVYTTTKGDTLSVEKMRLKEAINQGGKWGVWTKDGRIVDARNKN